MLSIPYDSVQFPPGTVIPGYQELVVSWEDLLWSALTVGRPSIMNVFGYGQPSLYEAIFRISLVKMSLEQRGPNAKRLVRTGAFKQMDPTEKGAINYFIGLIICKLFAAKLLDAPWALHLDVFKKSLSPTLLTGRSRPDLVAQSASSQQWHAFECKGRASVPGEKEKRKAKDQACRLTHIGNTRCHLHIGAITFFQNDVLNFYWRDPEPPAARAVALPNPEAQWRAYYLPVISLLSSRPDSTIQTPGPTIGVPFPDLDLTIGIDRITYQYLQDGRWFEAYNSSRERRTELNLRGIRADGLSVTAGLSWSSRRDTSLSADE